MIEQAINKANKDIYNIDPPTKSIEDNELLSNIMQNLFIWARKLKDYDLTHRAIVDLELGNKFPAYKDELEDLREFAEVRSTL